MLPGVHATLGVLPCRTAQPARLRAPLQRSPERAPESVRRQPERWSGPAPRWRWAPAATTAWLRWWVSLATSTPSPSPGDVRDPQYNEALVAAAVEKWGRLDTVVANAGIGAYGGILDIDDAQLREMVETNYLATVWTVRSGVRQFRAQGDGGDIVIVSSVA